MSRHRQTIELFVVRARRVEEHSLAADPEKLAAWGQVRLTLQGLKDGTQRLIQEVPAEEILESAMARVRPIVLDGEPVYWAKALAAIGYVIRFIDDPERELAHAAYQELKKRWQSCTSQHGNPDDGSYYIVRADFVGGQVSAEELAFSWIYGDVVHADLDRQARGEIVGVQERHRAASGIVARMVRTTILTLNMIRKLQTNGHLDLPDEIFTKPVVSTDTTMIQTVKAFIGDPDDENPRAIDHEWYRQNIASHAESSDQSNNPRVSDDQDDESA